MNAKKLAGSRIVLLLCGSFNPPTILHLRMFERAKDFFQQECNCTVLEGLMSPVADNFRKKKPSLAPAIHRLQMVEFATASSSWIRADGWECQRERWYRTIEVLRYHRAQLEKRYPGHPRMHLVLLCGGDMVDSFTREDETHPSGKLWHPDHLREILADYGLVVIERVGSNARRTFQSANLDFLHDQLHNVAIIEDQTFPNEMSSTKLREAIHAGRSIRYCTPDSVVEYINENGLYKATMAEENDQDKWESIGANNDKKKDESLIKS